MGHILIQYVPSAMLIIHRLCFVAFYCGWLKVIFSMIWQVIFTFPDVYPFFLVICLVMSLMTQILSMVHTMNFERPILKWLIFVWTYCGNLSHICSSLSTNILIQPRGNQWISRKYLITYWLKCYLCIQVDVYVGFIMIYIKWWKILYTFIHPSS